ncbi:hypothetical protein FACS1894151_09340 [Spirochaetia bacterium]|nr:hypothetical protein FACS1894151_09340 [Spirochaetia bacterium]
MFENVLGQAAVRQISGDITGGVLAPSMLFSGSACSGKGTAALELARVLSCEKKAPQAAWNCSCSACERHRLLSHPDLLAFGPRQFSAEISASEAAFLREYEAFIESSSLQSAATSARMLFIRSVRKLLLRFSPVLMEDDPKIGKLSNDILAINEELEDLDAEPSGVKALSIEALKKNCDSIVKKCYKLEAEGIAESIPIAQIRRAAAWSHLAPHGERKFLLLENADRMQEGGRNALLKLLEEPPLTLTIVMTTRHEDALLPTILSRLRPYRFFERDGETETAVIQRVFRDKNVSLDSNLKTFTEKSGGKGSGIALYLDSFLPVSRETVSGLAAFFAASAAMGTILSLKKKRFPQSEILVGLGKYAAPLAESAGMGRPTAETKAVTALILEKAEHFETSGLFRLFLSSILSIISEAILRNGDGDEAGKSAIADIWRKHIEATQNAVSIYNQNSALALERLFAELTVDMFSFFSRGISL